MADITEEHEVIQVTMSEDAFILMCAMAGIGFPTMRNDLPAAIMGKMMAHEAVALIEKNGTLKRATNEIVQITERLTTILSKKIGR